MVSTPVLSRCAFTREHILFYIFSAAFFSMPLGTSLITLFGVLAVLAWIVTGTLVRYRHIYFCNACFRPVFFLMLVPWLCLAWSADPGDMGLGYAKKIHYWLYGLAFAGVAFNVFSPDRFIRAFMAGLVVNFCMAAAQMIRIVPSDMTGPTGFGRGYSTLCVYLVVGMLMASFFFWKEKGKNTRWVYPVLGMIFFFHLVVLDGRAGYVAFIALSPLMIRNAFKGLSPLWVGLVSVVLMAGMSFSPVVRDRVAVSVTQATYHFHAVSEASWGRVYTPHQDRFYMWVGAVDLIRDHPFFGVGTGGYQKALKQLRDPADPPIAHPHNDFLHMAVSYGVLGVAGFLWFFFEMLKNGWLYRDRPAGFFVLSVALVTLVSGLFNTHTLDVGTVFLLSLAVGMQQSLGEVGRLRSEVGSRRSEVGSLRSEV